MAKYYITEFKKEIKYKNRRTIAPGCTLDDESPEHIKEFDSLEQAEDALKEYPTSFWSLSGYWVVTEYGITIHEWDEDEEEYVWYDVYTLSEMNIAVETADSHDIITIVHSYKEGEEFIDKYEKAHKDDDDFEYLEMAL
nr:MAG TPA: hypothetical protein [Bacteriophage sp.]